MYDGVKLFLEIVGWFFVLYLLGYSTFLFISVLTGSMELYKHARRERLKVLLPADDQLPISIIVPAHNEEITAAATVRSLLTLDYRAYEIIVVDDGSTDDTARVLTEAFGLHRIQRPIHRRVPCQREEAVYESRSHKVPLTLICKKNGGKADALNMGINASRFPYFICMDADSVLQHDSLRRIIQPVLEDENVVAVGGLVRAANGVELENGRVRRWQLPRNLLVFMQTLEYDRSFLASRILFDRFNGSMIISGAFGLFKKETVVAVGGYERETVGRTWSWWCGCTNIAAPTTSAMPSATPATPSAGRRCRSGWAIFAGSASAGIWACSRASAATGICFMTGGLGRWGLFPICIS